VRPVPILGPATSTLAAVLANTDRSATGWFLHAVEELWTAGTLLGVDPVVLAAQAALETGWGKFGGVLDTSFNNTCGLKTARGGGDSDPNAHTRFPDLATGALAHAQHLYAYATARALPDGIRLVDPRFALVARGSAPTVDRLAGRWAPDPDYGRKITALVRLLRGEP
jgi:N-acetylmuramoyl-L-alanine amidase